MQLDLFSGEPILEKEPEINIPGLTYVENYITYSQEQKLISAVGNEPWDVTMKRRVQHYGYKYDYKARAVNTSMYLGSLPQWAQPIAKKMVQDGYYKTAPDQLIVNEYLPGQGISNHTDCQPCFSDTIISLSLGSGCIMNLTEIRTGKKVEFWLAPFSILMLQGEARYKWMHGIVPRKTDTLWNGNKHHRGTRISLTFRQVILK